ncbi:hypothetical protein ScalyP_jg3221 [Parmales sp. scaly parma]|nr:hypothetical protein ScalyP_jg3221 [Parmales sp. scaly parma]
MKQDSKHDSDEVMRELKNTIASTSSCLASIEETKSRMQDSLNASAALDERWKSVQNKFQEVLDNALAGISFNTPKKRSFSGPEQSLEDIVDHFRLGKYTKIVVLTGAGISTSCGIADFRSEGGIYQSILKESNDPTLTSPEDLFSLQTFLVNPKPFTKRAELMSPFINSKTNQYVPSSFHNMIKTLQDEGMLLRNYTQNIDSLERIAGVDSEHIVECHGSFSHTHCTKCDKTYLEKTTGERCECGSLVKANVVLFGENLKQKFALNFRRDLQQADLLIVAGTSLKVPPFSNLPSMVSNSCPRILINNERSGVFELETEETGCTTIEEEEVFSDEKRDAKSGDFVLLGDIDTEVKKLSARIGLSIDKNVAPRQELEFLRAEIYNDFIEWEKK